MGGIKAKELSREGYQLAEQISAALPMAVWALDLEIETQRPVSAAELTILRLLDTGVRDVATLTRMIGLGSDGRLVERVLVNLLASGAIDTAGEGFATTDVGRTWSAEGSAPTRERVTQEVRLDPARGAFEWADAERPVYGGENTWTIDLPSVGDAALLLRKDELGELVRTEGLPHDDERAPGERRPAIDLRAVAIVSRRVHWRAVRLDVHRHEVRGDVRIIGHIGDAENPPLTKLLANLKLNTARRRVIPTK